MDRHLNVAFPVVLDLVTVDLSGERFFNGVFEQGLIINQPEVVRVDYEGFEFLLGKISRGVKGIF